MMVDVIPTLFILTFIQGNVYYRQVVSLSNCVVVLSLFVLTATLVRIFPPELPSLPLPLYPPCLLTAPLFIVYFESRKHVFIMIESFIAFSTLQVFFLLFFSRTMLRSCV